MQLEAGAQVTDFEFRPLALEQMLCERYYRRLNYTNGFAATTVAARFFGPLQPSMRAAPTPSLLKSAPVIYAPALVTGSSSSIVSWGTRSDGWNVLIDGFSGLTAGNGAMMQTQNVFALDAEL